MSRKEIPMNIMVILHSHICGGAEVHALALMRGLAHRGHKVAFAGPDDSWLAEKAQENSIESIHVPMHGMVDLISLFLLVRSARRWKPDLLHGHLVRGTHYATMTGRVIACPTVATAHSTISYKRFHRAGHVIAVSEAVKDSLVARQIRSSKITRIYHGIPDSFVLRKYREDVRKNLGIKEDECALCMVARFIPDKGHDLLLRAFSGLKDRRFKLFLAGEDSGPWAREIRSMAKDRDLEGSMVFLGFKEDVPRFMAGMDILIAPSRREALSISIIEALSMGLPVIAARVGGIPEVVRNRVNGLLVEKENAKELREAISYLVSHPDVRHAYGLKGRELFLQEFSEGEMVDCHLRLYRSLTHRSCASPPVLSTKRSDLSIAEDSAGGYGRRECGL
jgi:glycosyltransferase involved in cell wall biosynthesis